MTTGLQVKEHYPEPWLYIGPYTKLPGLGIQTVCLVLNTQMPVPLTSFEQFFFLSPRNYGGFNTQKPSHKGRLSVKQPSN